MSWLPEAIGANPVLASIVWAAIMIAIAGYAPRLWLLDRLEEILITLLIVAATLLIFASVFHRYGLSNSIALANWGKAHGLQWLNDGARALFKFLGNIDMTWAQEACIYMFVWMAKFGAAYGVRTGVHVGVDVALNSLSTRSRRRVVLFGLACGALFTFVIGSFGTRFVWHIAHTDQTTPDLELPVWLVYLAIPLGSYLMCFRFMEVAWSFARTGELPHHNEAHVAGISDEPSPLGAPVTATTGATR